MMKKMFFKFVRCLCIEKKLCLSMRLTVILTILLSVNVYAGAWSQTVSLRMENVTLREIFKAIKQQTGVYFVFNEEEIIASHKQSIEISNVSIESAMSQVLKGLPYSYEYLNGVIVIKPMQQQTDGVKVCKLSGRVVDVKGNPLPGVTVQIAKTNWGTVTDVDGKYILEVPNVKGMKIIFSFIGMKTKEVIYKDEAVVNIILEENITEIQEVVVTGFQNIDKRYSTSAITSVKAEDVLVAGMTSIDAALEGKIPELLLMSNSGEVGAAPRIRIRGTSTLLGNREPLWVLDGIVLTDPVRVDPQELNNPDYINVIGNAIAGINPQDIERIDVLKDASATALYGTRAANGVIVITTKKGRSGKARLTYNHTSKLTLRPRYTNRDINLMNSQERVRFGKELTDIHYQFPEGMVMVGYEGAYYRLMKGNINYEQFLDEVKFYEEVNTDWFDELTQDAYSHGHNINISGGSDDTRYYTSIGYDRENGVSRSTFTERYTAMVNLNTVLFNKLRLGLQLNGNVQKKNHQIESINSMDYAYNTTRALPAYNEDGSLYYYDHRYYNVGMNSIRKYRFNILNEIDNSSSEYDGHGISARLDLRYEIMTGWDVSLIASVNRSSTTQERWWGEKTHYVAMLKDAEWDEQAPLGDNCILPYGGILETSSTTSQGFTVRAQSDYRKAIGKDMNHLITIALGFEASNSKYHTYSMENRGYVKDRGMQFVENISLSDFPIYADWLSKNHPFISENITNMVAGYATLSYSYKQHFTFNVNGRFDASNKFGDKSSDKFLPVWSISGMWNAKENLLRNLDFFSNLQFRASLGIQGNMLEDQSPNLIINQGVVDPFYGENISTVARYPNPNLRWEETKSLNLTLDMDMFDSRLSLSGTYYYKKTKNCFTDVEVSPINGIYTYTMNDGDLWNKGYSLAIGGVPIRRENFTWRISSYWSANYNKVDANPENENSLNSYLNGDVLINGKPVGTFYSYKFLGLNPNNGVPVFDDYEERKHLLEGKSISEIVPMVLKENGTREPKFYGNLSTSFNFKGFMLSASFTYSLGSKVRLFPLYSPVLSGIKSDNNVRKEFANRWQVPGDETLTNIPVIMSPSHPEYASYERHWSREFGSSKFANSVWEMYDLSDLRVVSGNYLKCQSLTLRYTFDEKFLRKTPFSSAYISFNTMNLFTISAKALKGQDPSQAGFAKPNLSVRPAYSLGLNVSF